MSDVEGRLAQVLGGWAVASVVVGAALTVFPRTRGFGRQTVAWGAIDGAIAEVGARRRAAKGPTDPARLRRVLLVNAGLDVGYLLAGGHVLARTRWKGDGLAVLVQGVPQLRQWAGPARTRRRGPLPGPGLVRRA